jgi:hypothetical protein
LHFKTERGFRVCGTGKGHKATGSWYSRVLDIGLNRQQQASMWLETTQKKKKRREDRERKEKKGRWRRK